jgi:hypothetical protein
MSKRDIASWVASEEVRLSRVRYEIRQRITQYLDCRRELQQMKEWLDSVGESSAEVTQ